MSTKGARCAALSCNNYRRLSNGISFFRFPSERKRCLRWIMNSRRKDLEAMYPYAPQSYFNRNMVLCAEHFNDCCFMNSQRKRLVHDAVPSLFTFTLDSNGCLPSHRLREPRTVYKDLLKKSIQDANEDAEYDYGETLEESRQLDRFIKSCFEESKESNSVNICIPHEHTRTSSDGSVQEPSSSHSFISPINQESLLHGDTLHNSSSETRSSYFICCASGCLHTSNSSMLFPFPNKSQQAIIWLERCGQTHLKPLITSAGSVPKNYLLCEHHFAKDQFIKSSDGVKLVCHALPTLFMEQQVQTSNVDKNERLSTVILLNSAINLEHSKNEKVIRSKLSDCDKELTVKSLKSFVPILPKPSFNLNMLNSESITPNFSKSHGINAKSAVQSKKKMVRWEKDKFCTKPIATNILSNKSNLVSVNSYKSKRTNKSCSFKGCMADLDAILFFKFPSDSDRCRAWVANCGTANLPSSLLRSKAPSNTLHRLCSKHFESNCFTTASERRVLVNYAVPTVFPHKSIKYPCQHKSLAEQFRQCDHQICNELIKAGAYSRPIEAPATFSEEKKRNNLSALSYAVFNKEIVTSEGSSSEIDSDSDSMSSFRIITEPNELDAAGETRVVTTITDELHHDSPTTSSVSTAVSVEGSRPSTLDSTQDFQAPKKSIVTDKELEHLQREYKLLKKYSHCLSQKKHQCIRSIEILKTSESFNKNITVNDAFEYCKSRLNKSMYQFFLCQRLNRKNHWSLEALDIPFIANRCGGDVNETLSTILRMPCGRTLNRHRRAIRKDPSKVPSSNICVQDLKRVYHRAIPRASPKNKHFRAKSSRIKSISDIINDYVSKHGIGLSDNEQALEISQSASNSSSDDVS